MAFKIVLLTLLVCFAASEAQSQGDDTSLPLSYNATELQGDGATCPNDQLRQETRDNITTDVRTLLQDTVVPEILNLIPTPFCPCISSARRIAYLDMTDPNQQCPPNWQEISTSGVRSCTRTNNAGASCDSAFYPNTGGNSYSQVCGRVIGYQYCTACAFGHLSSDDINSFYVDGVSITHSNPRRHVWSFATGYFEGDTSTTGCPCVDSPNSANARVPSFVGNDYFCDSGNTGVGLTCRGISIDLLIDHPLWDGGGCGPTGTCCESNNPPWFCTTLPQPTTDDIEVRLCTDEALANEEVTVELIEIFVN